MKHYFVLRHLIFLLFICPLCIQGTVDSYVPKIIRKIPHDISAFTQGLAIENHLLFESTGLYEQSTLRITDLTTGTILKKRKIPSQFFGEGIALFPDRIIQVTWKEQTALIYDIQTLELLASLPYEGEGWGLCRDKDTVWMSNGGSFLIQRDSRSFTVLNKIQIRWDGQPVQNLNDLECVGQDLYLNVFHSNHILKVNKSSGNVVGVIDVGGLLSPHEKASLKSQESVVNGIAYHSLNKTFLVTGKNWPYIFEVEFIPKK